MPFLSPNQQRQSTVGKLYCRRKQDWKPGIFRDFPEHGKLGGILCNLRENCSKQSSFSSPFKYLWIFPSKVLTNEQSLVNFWHGHSVVLTGYIAGVDVEWPMVKVIITFTFVVTTDGKVSLWLWNSLENLRKFCSVTLWPPVLFPFWKKFLFQF